MTEKFFLKLTVAIMAVLFSAALTSAEPPPSSFDLRDIGGHSYIGPVRDQGDCGSCWAFAALAAAESTWNRAHGLHDNRALNLSESFLVWSLSPLYDGLDGCEGADSISRDELRAMVEYGAPLESVFPYTTTDPGDALHWDAPRYSMEDWYHIPLNDVETTRRVLHSIGAVNIAVFSDRDEWGDYEGGIYEDGYQTPTEDNMELLDHAVALVGYNDNPGDDGLGYWVLRNSWNDYWGEEGYMRIRYTSSMTNLMGHYFIAEPWSGESVDVINTVSVAATPWIAGGTLNAHGADLWGGAASSFTNLGTVEAIADDGGAGLMATARGVYLWGGPEGYVTNKPGGTIGATALSDNSQSFAYGICMQGGEIINEGEIAANAGSASNVALAYGIWAANGGNSLSIKNSGVTSASAGDWLLQGAYGILSENHQTTLVRNEGTISASAGDSAIGVAFSGGQGLLANYGTIEAEVSLDDGELFFSGGWGVAGSWPTTVINHGTIRGSTGSLFLLGENMVFQFPDAELIGLVSLAGNDSSITNYGTISGNGQAILVEGDFNTITNKVEGSISGSVIAVEGPSNLLENFGSITGDIDMGIGTLALRSQGTVTGVVTNQGTVTLDGGPGVSTIDGDYIHHAGAVLKFSADNGASDRLSVTGTADLQGGTAAPAATSTILNGDTFTIINAGTLTGTFDEHGHPSVVLGFTPTYTATELLLEAHRTPYATALSDLGPSSNLSAIIAILTPLIGTDGGNMVDVLNIIDTQPTAAALAGAMNQMSPEIYTAASTTSALNRTGFMDNVAGRLGSLRAAAARPLIGGGPEREQSEWTPWVRGTHTRANQDSGAGFMGYGYDASAMYLGMDKTMNDRLTLGLSLGVGQASAETDGSLARIDADSFLFGLYGSWKKTAFYADSAALYSSNDYRSIRHLPAFDLTAQGDYRGRDCAVYLGGGYHASLGAWNLVPSASLQYGYHQARGFTETGADVLNLQVEKATARSLSGKAGFRLNRFFQVNHELGLVPEFSLHWGHEFADKDHQATARLSGVATPITVSGVEAKRDSILAGASLTTLLRDDISFFVSWKGERRSDFDGHTWQAGLRFAF